MFKIPIGLLFVSLAMGQAVFDAASIRVVESGEGGRKRENVQVNPGSLNMRSVTLKSAIRWAYHVMDYQVSGPYWLGDQRFDIVAKAAGPAPENELRTMLQALLADRFKLKLHKETKELSAYVLVVAKGGIKFHESKEEGELAAEPDKNHLTVTLKKVPASQFVEMLSEALRAPVINKTGLEGRYDATINMSKYMSIDTTPKDGPFDPIPMIVTGLQEELGLKLESKKMPLDLLIIDHAEKVPTEN